jgi:hypothetical protein
LKGRKTPSLEALVRDYAEVEIRHFPLSTLPR